MKIAFISDIHANLEALEAVLEDAGRNGAEEIYCLGDIVGYGANPNECAAMVAKRCTGALLGNHDAVAIGELTPQHFNVHARIAIEWTAEQLTEPNKSFLRERPMIETLGNNLTMVHATPYAPGMWYYITSIEEAAYNFEHFDTQICLVGHTHIPVIIVEDEDGISVHQEKKIYYGNEDSGDLRLLINIGSVGQPRDRNPQSSYGILDTDEKTFTLRRVPYNVAVAQAKMKKHRMPDFLVNRLAEGR